MASSDIVSENILFVESILTINISLKCTQITANVHDKITKKIKHLVEDKCITDGYIVPDSVILQEYSSPKILNGEFLYECKYLCRICTPVCGMVLECVCFETSIGGIHGIYEYYTDTNKKIQPIEVYVIREHNNTHPDYALIKRGDHFKACIIGVDFTNEQIKIHVIAVLVAKI